MGHFAVKSNPGHALNREGLWAGYAMNALLHCTALDPSTDLGMSWVAFLVLIPG